MCIGYRQCEQPVSPNGLSVFAFGEDNVPHINPLMNLLAGNTITDTSSTLRSIALSNTAKHITSVFFDDHVPHPCVTAFNIYWKRKALAPDRIISQVIKH